MIKKLYIKNITDKVDIQIIPNLLSIGFDIAEHLSGITIIRTTDKYLFIEQIQTIIVPKKIQGLNAIDLFTEQLEDFKRQVSTKYKFDIGIIEDSFLKFNVATLKTLAKFGVLVYDRFKNLVNKIEFKYPTSVRSKVKFKKSNTKIKGKYLKNEIVDYVNNLFELKLTYEDHDKADSTLIAFSGVIK